MLMTVYTARFRFQSHSSNAHAPDDRDAGLELRTYLVVERDGNEASDESHQDDNHLQPHVLQTQQHNRGACNVTVSVELKVALHEQVKVTVCHTAEHYGEEYDD